jgi:hypothetical protein
MVSAAAHGDRLQVYLDAHGVATALAIGGLSEAALEAVGIGRAEGADTGYSLEGLFEAHGGHKALLACRAELGEEAAEAAVARGRSVPAGQRVERIRSLVGARAPSSI